MKIAIDCIPCLSRQALTALRMIDISDSKRLKIIREVLKYSATVPLDDSPPAVPSDTMHRIIRNLSDNPDPFFHIKNEYNHAALKLETNISNIIHNAPDMLYTAIKFAIIGNVIDFGVHHKRFDLNTKINALYKQSLAIDDYASFEKDLEKATGVMILHDNAGEIVFDKILAEILNDMGKIVISAVKGGPVINDALLADANAVGLDNAAKIITNGNDYVGTMLEKCNAEFLQYFNNPDFLIISKGQANFETLNRNSRKIYFLLQAKCDVLVRELNVELGGLIFWANH